MKIAAALALGNEKALDRSPMNQVSARLMAD